MSEQDSKITELEARLDRLVRTQIDFQTEITRIRSELAGFRAGNQPFSATQTPPPAQNAPPPRPRPPVREPASQSPPYEAPRNVPPPNYRTPFEGAGSSASSGDAFSRYVSEYTENAKANLEKFIGENLISKIGIVILILGVGIGAKYAIDNNLISPLTRIIIGYIFGFGLVGLAIKLKPKYLNFSAVLLSGGMAILYFVTYFAYSLYALIPQLTAFALMALFTLLTVGAALLYSRQVIAHIGLVGAYAVPFLLSDNSGNYLFLFAYMAILNTGILAVSIKKYWRPLFYTSSAFTWLIFYGWFITKYSASEHFYLALVFLAVFFAIFYATKMVHGVLHSETAYTENLVSVLVTGFIFFGFCLAISDVETDAAKYRVFFTYLATSSLAILVTSYRFYGRFLIYLTFPFTWLVFGVWYLNRYNPAEHFYIAAVFSTVFFALFYFTTLAHRLISEKLNFIENTSLVLTNSFLFYGFGYSIMDGNDVLRNYLGLYTAAHAALHFAVAQFVSRFRSSAVDVVQVLTILILTFASIAIPVQFDGNTVTMIWAVEGALLFWFGRARQIRLFEYFSYPVMVLATGSMFLDWATSYGNRISGAGAMAPVANGDFVTALVFIAAFAFIFVTNRDEKFEPAIDADFVRPFGYVVGAVGLFVLYNMFRIEIGNYYHLRAVNLRTAASEDVPVRAIADLGMFNVIWQINYTMFFLIAMAVANLKRFRSRALSVVNVGLGILCLQIFATIGMFLFHELRESYLIDAASMNIAIRYISYVFAGGLLYALYVYSRDELLTDWVSAKALGLGFEVVFYSFIFIAASCELVNLMGQFHIPDATKLGLSILWGAYALVLIVLGIAWDKKHLRIAAMALLGVTLAKLFFYDIADLGTIPKTILFVTLGITLLVISFLYTKYKDLIFGSSPEPETEPQARSVDEL